MSLTELLSGQGKDFDASFSSLAEISSDFSYVAGLWSVKPMDFTASEGNLSVHLDIVFSFADISSVKLRALMSSGEIPLLKTSEEIFLLEPSVREMDLISSGEMSSMET